MNSLFETFGIGWFEWNNKHTHWLVKQKFFSTLEEAKNYYYSNLKHNHDKTLFSIDNEKNDKILLDFESLG